MKKKKTLNPSVLLKQVERSHQLIILTNPQSLSRGRLRAADALTTRVLLSLGGLAAEELGEPVAWGSGRRDPDAEETPAEHAHINPRAAQEHEMETVGSASTQALFHFHPPQTLCDVHFCLFVSGLSVCVCVYMDP